jgi:hypothetical protein
MKLHHARGFRASVPERMRDPPRLDHIRPRGDRPHQIANLVSKLARKHIGALVLTSVGVRGDELTGRITPGRHCVSSEIPVAILQDAERSWLSVVMSSRSLDGH